MNSPDEKRWSIPLSIVLAAIIIAGGIMLDKSESTNIKKIAPEKAASFLIPASWNNLGQEMIANGTIDPEKIPYAEEFDGRPLRITKENSHRLLNLLWAFGLSSKNVILEEGEMADPRYGGPENFASTAGWTVAMGDVMNHYSAHRYFDLTEEEQGRVDKVSREIYRPCCSNSAHFPDCNHGMAMLGLLELIASEGLSEDEMRKAAHTVNSFWFPEFYNQKRSAPSGGCSV